MLQGEAPPSFAGWASVPFRYPLADDHRHEEQDMDLRGELAHALAPLGWAQASKGFRKRTARGNELSIDYDRKPLSNVTSAWLAVRGARWRYSATLWPHIDRKALRIRSPLTARLYASNLATAAEHAISRWAEPIEALHGDTEGWLPQRR